MLLATANIINLRDIPDNNVNPANFYLFKVNNRNTRKKIWNMFKVNNKNMFYNFF